MGIFGGSRRRAEWAASRGWSTGGPAESIFDTSWLIFRLFGPAGGRFRNVVLNPSPTGRTALGAATFQGQSGAGAELLEVVAAPLARPVTVPMIFLATGNTPAADQILGRLSRTRFAQTGLDALDRRWRILATDIEAAEAALRDDPDLSRYMEGIEPQRWMAYEGEWTTRLPEDLHRRTAGKLIIDLEPDRLVVGVDASTGATWRRDGLVEFAETLSQTLT